MKIKLYSVLISVFLLISFSSFAEANVKSIKTEKSSKNKSQSVAGKKVAESISFKSSVYNKSGLIKRKGSRKSCPAFQL
jgi:hypothetical protein